MKNISFSLTTEQFKARTKTVTRRLGWKTLKPGQHLMGCKKCMGLKPGEKIEKLGEIRIVRVWQEQVQDIHEMPLDLAREGFPGKTPEWFVEMFCREMHVKPETMIMRIEFEYV